jgi:hypothetical protein
MLVALVRLSRKVAVAVALLSFGALAEAVPVPAVSIDNLIGQTLGNPPFTLGWTFTVDDDIVVTQLGLFDSLQNGLVESHEIGIWDEVGALVATATIGSGVSGQLIDNFRYVGIVPVTLGAGAYTIGAFFGTGDEPLVFAGSAMGFATSPHVDFVSAAYLNQAGLTLPDSLITGEGYFGPNFTRDDINVAAVPEPGTLALIASGIAGLGWRRRRPRLAAAL